MARPLILLSNDDGVYAPGIRLLREALSAEFEVTVVAPLTEQSAHSHSLTIARPLRHRWVDGMHTVDGTPADSIYTALYHPELLPRRPDLVVSGINHGYNLGVDTFYSGTVAAAREAALRGLPALAFSLGPGGDMARAAPLAASLVARFWDSKPSFANGVPLLNINIPSEPTPPLGVRVVRLGRRVYDEEVDARRDPRGNSYFWIGGPSVRHEPHPDSDTEAVDAGFVSVTPLRLEVTDPDPEGYARRLAGSGELPQ